MLCQNNTFKARWRCFSGCPAGGTTYPREGLSLLVKLLNSVQEYIYNDNMFTNKKLSHNSFLTTTKKTDKKFESDLY